MGRVQVIGPGGDPQAGEERVSLGSLLGSPFVARPANADEAVVCYWELLKGERSVYEIGREAGVSVHETQSRVTHERRVGTLNYLALRAWAGETVYLRCPHAVDVPVGDLVRAWVERTVERLLRDLPRPA